MRFFGPTSKLIKLHAWWILYSGLAIGLGSCAVSEKQINSAHDKSPKANAPAIQVVTTFLPVTQFTKAVAGDRAQVTQLLPIGIGPHDYQAKPEDIQVLAKANVLVQNGLDIETFLDNLVKNAGNAKLQIIDASKGIKPITTESIESHPSQNQSGSTTHQHGHFNPHIWLDPKRVIQQVMTIRDGLVAADPTGKETYTSNAAAYLQKLKILDHDITAELKPYKGKTFVAYHDFAPYFAQSYNLTVKFLVDVPEENPSPEDVKRVIKTVKDSHLKTLLSEPQVGEGVFLPLAKDLKVKVSSFNSLETGTNESLATDYYLTEMRKNLNNLKTAFEK